MQQTHQITVSRTAHYSTLGQTGSEIKYCWIVCHGYGQLAKYFIRKFEAIARPDALIIAPEGLSRFYWGGFTGNVVASWMTREDRLDEIADYSNYLSQLYDLYIPQLAPDVKIVLLGFSQGCATQVRWMRRRKPAFHHLVIWGGLLPEDIDYTPYLTYFEQGRLHLAYGTEDIYLTPERMNQQQEIEEKYKLILEKRPFKGKHTVEREALLALEKAVRKK